MLLVVLVERKLSMFSKVKSQLASLDFSKRGKKTTTPMLNLTQCKRVYKLALISNAMTHTV